jgi:uracil-DNA glycosylase
MACRPRLNEFIRLAQPKLIVTVGTLAHDWLDYSVLDVFNAETGKHDKIRTETIVHPSYVISHMPIAQRDMAIRKCVSTIANALEELI